MVAVEAFVLSALVGRIILNVDTIIQRELGLAWDAKEELEKLRSVLSTIRAVLLDAGEQQSHSQAMQDWLKKLQEASDDAMIFLDGFSQKARNQVLSLLSLSIRFPFVNKSPRKIKKIKERFEAIANERKYHLNVGGKSPVVAAEEETDSSLPPSEIYERETAKEKTVVFLVDTSFKEELSFLAIVGIPGIGKTVLAKLAFNDERVKAHFSNDLMIWVWVSDGFDVQKIAQKIIQSAVQTPCDNLDMDQSKKLLQQTLSGRKFLLVLDNVWNESDKKWEELKRWLSGGNHGSKIIVTTCNNRVANIIKPVAYCHLEDLTESYSWTIFAQKAFREVKNVNQFNEENGRKIAAKSKGVPLAAEALGRLMRQMTDEREWLSVKNSEIWNLAEENEILPALRLSYKHLPPHSHRCLAYCSIFPRDYEIDKEKLIKLWIANDFIPSKGSKEVEDLGHETFKHLLDRFFFQPLQKDEDGRIITFKLQGLIYDLARSEMDAADFIRHFCCQVKTSSDVPDNIANAQCFRTFLLLNTPGRYIAEVPHSTFKKFKLLRVLDLSCTDLSTLPESISNLLHLRYLDLAHTNIERLPEVICRLNNLQSLILKGCLKLTKLPAGMRKMGTLRHLDIDECKSLVQMPDRIGQLHFLQTLPIFIVGEKKGRRIGELGILNLREKLKIRYLENIVSVSDAEDANLKEKEHLNTLSLSWDRNCRRNLVDVDQVLDALEPHRHLKRLSIRGYPGKRFPSWLRNSYLLTLVGITLIDCKRCEHLPPLGELPSLKSLTIDGLEAVQYLGNALYGSNTKLPVFPSLEELECLNMTCLQYWKLESRLSFPRLAKLTIRKCQYLSNLPRISSWSSTLKYLEIAECPNLKSMKELKNLYALEALKIKACEGLMSSPEGLKCLASLKSLEVYNCCKLTSLPQLVFEGLHSLHCLIIQNCRNLTSFSGGLKYLTNLHSMKISGCPKLLSLQEGTQNLISLQDLAIDDCVRLTSLPKGTQKDLQISGCPNLITSPKWARNLKLLESLVIKNCQNLKFLPPEMKTMMALRKLQIQNCHSLIEMPEWLTNLTSLQILKISDCDSLEQIPAGLRHQTRIQVDIKRCPQLKKQYAERSKSLKIISSSRVQPLDPK